MRQTYREVCFLLLKTIPHLAYAVTEVCERARLRIMPADRFWEFGSDDDEAVRGEPLAHVREIVAGSQEAVRDDDGLVLSELEQKNELL